MIVFSFTINKSLLSYTSRPITIPKEYYADLESEGLNKCENAILICPNGRRLDAFIYSGVAGYGPYYQIRVRNGHAGDCITSLEVGERVTVSFLLEGTKPYIKLDKME